jgi:hypothetical protein
MEFVHFTIYDLFDVESLYVLLFQFLLLQILQYSSVIHRKVRNKNSKESPPPQKKKINPMELLIKIKVLSHKNEMGYKCYGWTEHTLEIKS